MDRCSKCGTRYTDGTDYCPYCAGEETPAPLKLKDEEEFYRKRDAVEFEKDCISFIGKNADRYLPKFDKFMRPDGTDGFKMTWHWPAFFFGALWLVYRKLYLWFFAFLAICFIPVDAILIAVALAMSANYIYFKHINKKLSELRETKGDLSDEEWDAKVAGAGGTALLPALLVSFLIVGLSIYYIMENSTHAPY